MAAEQALALVIRTTDWSESSRIVTLFTKEWGKVRGLAKGGRRLKSNFEVALDLLNVCSIVLLRKSTEGLELLTEARVEERFPQLRTDLSLLYAGYYLAELLDLGLHDHDPHPNLFDTVISSLRDMNTRKDWAAHRILEFEARWVREIGVTPFLDGCVSCGVLESTEEPTRWWFSPSAGGIVCARCQKGFRDQRPISRAGLKFLRDTSVGETDWNESLWKELRPLMNQYVCHVLGKRPKLLNYLG